MDNTKEKLIKTAYRLIRANGFDSFSYNDLSQAVGIRKASIHYYFPNKEELGLAICDRIMQSLDWLKGAVAEKACAQEKFTFCVNWIHGQLEEGLICPISSLQAEYNVIPVSMKNKLKEITEAELALVADILQEGLDDGTFHFSGDAFTQAAIFITSLKSATLYARVLEQDLPTRIIEQYMNQLKKKD